MGCDIHAVVEKRVGRKWICVNTLSEGMAASSSSREEKSPYVWLAALSRNYARFAALAGVRGEGPAPFGLPDTLSETAKFLIEDFGEDGHSHSWLPLAKAAEIFLATEHFIRDEDKSLIGKNPVDFFFNVNKENVKDYRLVFWFDN